MIYKYILKHLLFLLKPEKAHQFALSIFNFFLYLPGASSVTKLLFAPSTPNLKKKLWGLSFPNPIGLAAGFDKDGRHLKKLSRLGFGFIEIGTVTPLPQPGNPKPRLFRLPADKALINRMGFNNEGVDALVKRLKKYKSGHIIIGGNIGKNKNTPNEKAHIDYFTCFDKLFPFVDYFVVNVSSPNTPDLRALQDKEPLLFLLDGLQKKNILNPQPKPILLKIAPDLSDAQLNDILEIVHKTNIAGIIATNTTIDRQNLKTPASKINQIGNGGLSGQPLKNRSTEIIKYLKANAQDENMVIIGVGGISSPEDAIEKLNAGASLVQLYSGLVYEGPGLVSKINRFLEKDSQKKR